MDKLNIHENCSYIVYGKSSENRWSEYESYS